MWRIITESCELSRLPTPSTFSIVCKHIAMDRMDIDGALKRGRDDDQDDKDKEKKAKDEDKDKDEASEAKEDPSKTKSPPKRRTYSYFI